MAREHQLTSGPSCFKPLSGKEIMPNMICGEGAANHIWPGSRTRV
jgi:hypothetical protein